MYNTIYIRMVGIESYRGAVQALQALATLDGEVDIRRSHLKEVQKFYLGAVNLGAFSRDWAAAAGQFRLYASTFRDPVFRAKMEINLNKVAEKVRDIPVDDRLGRPLFVGYGEGEMKYMAVFLDNRAYLAALWGADPATAATPPAGDQLLITDMTVFRDKFLEHIQADESTSE